MRRWRRDEPARPLPIGDVVTVGDRFTARGGIAATPSTAGPSARRSVRAYAEIVDDDLRALPRELQRMGRPMPRPAPVTMTTRPSQIPVMVAHLSMIVTLA
jgi:hypothetical protein